MTGENRGRGRPRKTESTYADTRNDLIRSGLELLTQSMPLLKMPMSLKAHFITTLRVKRIMLRPF